MLPDTAAETDLFHAVNKRIVDIVERAVPKRYVPWQLRLVQIAEEPDRQVLQENALVGEAGRGAEEQGQSW